MAGMAAVAWLLALGAVDRPAGGDLVRRGEYRACLRARRCPALLHTSCRSRQDDPLRRAPHAAARAYCAWRGLLLGEVEPRGFRCRETETTPTPTPVIAAPARAGGGSITLAAVGDVIFGRYHADRSYHPVSSVADPFAGVAETLRAADIAFCNLETPMMAEPPSFSVFESLTFRADPDRAPVMARAGFDVVSIANNHMTNISRTAPAQTRRNLERAGLRPAGAGATAEEAFHPAVVEVRGRRVAVLAFTTWSNSGRTLTDAGAVAYTGTDGLLAAALPAVRAARAKFDYVVVSIHWGREHAPVPAPEQRRIARRIVEAGADVVLGHHPHVVQPIERIGRGVVAYSLGNFLFGNPRLDTRRSLILEVELRADGVGRVALVPVLAGRDALPRLASGPEGRRWARVLQRLAPAAAGAGPPITARVP
jgi:poly-gamma-glutamate capsule biosynthesis protein CapA/YwtB (metallophosphatase superfamily)